MIIIVLTSLWWAAFWSLSIPSTIMLAFPRVCTIQVISMIAGVVGCWGVGIASHPDFTVLWSIEFRAYNCVKNYISVNLYDLEMELLLTPLHWTTFWNISIPSTIMLALSRVWPMQVVSIVTSVVGCWGVAITSHPDLTILGCNEFGTVDYIIDAFKNLVVDRIETWHYPLPLLDGRHSGAFPYQVPSCWHFLEYAPSSSYP